MATEKYTPRLKAEYQNRIRAEMKAKFGYTNEMQVPKLDKIVLNMGIGEAVADSKKANAALKDLTAIAGQKAVATKARNSIAGFKLREGMVIGGKFHHDRAAAREGLPRSEGHVLRRSRQLRHRSEGTHRVPGNQLRPDRPDVGHGHCRLHHGQDR
jgi:ribosomal protein L5